MKKLFKAIAFEDAILFLGLILLGSGLWLYEPWISLSVVGGALIMIGGMPLITAAIRSTRNGTNSKTG